MAANNDAEKSLNTKTAGNTENATGGKKPRKKVSALVAASKGRSAVNAVTANSSGDVRGTNGLANTGPVTSYENED